METLLTSKLTPKELQFLVQEAKEYAFSTGFVMGSASSGSVNFAPFCLFPSPFPKEWFAKAKDVQTSLNLLLHRISRDTKFLKECLSKTLQTDDFIQKLFEILDAVTIDGYKQKLSLGIFRMDYMLDTVDGAVTGMKQVEMNAISTSFGAFSSLIQPLHQHILKHSGCSSVNYPKSESLLQIASGIIHAWNAYGNKSAIVVFVIESKVTNFSDQRLLEYAMCSIDNNITVKRYTFKELHATSCLKEHKLYVAGDEVAVVYYRTAYMPDQFEDKDAWHVRLLMERSLAIQCPNVPLQLAGMKKVQQELTKEGVLEKFLSDVSQEMIRNIKILFAGQFSLDLNEEGDRAAEMATTNPERYVLKPQREGGGNNFFGTEIVEVLDKLQGNDREAYILMELIVPPIQKNYIIRRDMKDLNPVDIVGELGIYGIILGNDDDILVNNEVGHLLRCKVHGVNEGGVAAGYGALNQPYLV